MDDQFYQSDWDANSQHDPMDHSAPPAPDPRMRSLKMATAAMTLAIVAEVTFFFCYLSIPLAALAVILALLSRGDQKLLIRARFAIIIGIAAAVISAAVTAYSVITVMKTPELRSQMERIIEYYFPEYSQELQEIDDSYIPQNNQNVIGGQNSINKPDSTDDQNGIDESNNTGSQNNIDTPDSTDGPVQNYFDITGGEQI